VSFYSRATQRGPPTSKHVGRKQRWARQNAHTFTSRLGTVAYQQDAWYALLDYRTLAPPRRPGGPPTWVAQARRLGPFKRPRDAMVALEREATVLLNRHGKDVLLGDQVWAEA
jgi:hypothetical protein